MFAKKRLFKDLFTNSRINVKPDRKLVFFIVPIVLALSVGVIAYLHISSKFSKSRVDCEYYVKVGEEALKSKEFQKGVSTLKPYINDCASVNHKGKGTPGSNTDKLTSFEFMSIMAKLYYLEGSTDLSKKYSQLSIDSYKLVTKESKAGNAKIARTYLEMYDVQDGSYIWHEGDE